MTEFETPAQGAGPAAAALPTAHVAPQKSSALVWLLPLGALLLIGYAGFRSWVERGAPVEVAFAHGHGLKAGDTVRYRGISVGEVRRVRLGSDLRGVVLDLRLDSDAAALAREDSRFWIVRPQIGFGGIAGLDTLVGARYIAVQPGPDEAPRARVFVGLEEPPVLDPAERGRLEIVLEAPSRGSLQPGSPITFRQIRIGSVLSLDLAKDASSVEVRAAIDASKRGIIRHDTRFWETSGLEISVGFSGMDVRLESLASLLVGGIAVATPSPLGEAIDDEHRFTLHRKPEEEWLEWSPPIPLGIGGSETPEQAAGPPPSDPVPLRMVYRFGRFLSRDRSRDGWAVVVEGGLLAPPDLVTPPDDAATCEIFLDGVPVELPVEGRRTLRSGLVFVPVAIELPAWPASRRRSIETPEDCLIYQGSAAGPLALASSRLRPSGAGFDVDASVGLQRSDHGAAVVSGSDGKLVGVVLVDEDERARVAPAL